MTESCLICQERPSLYDISVVLRLSPVSPVIVFFEYLDIPGVGVYLEHCGSVMRIECPLVVKLNLAVLFPI